MEVLLVKGKWLCQLWDKLSKAQGIFFFVPFFVSSLIMYFTFQHSFLYCVARFLQLVFLPVCLWSFLPLWAYNCSCFTYALQQCFLIGLSFLIGLVSIRTIRTINRPLIGLIVHIIVQHIAGLYKYISYMYGIYIIYHILYIYIVDIEHISS